VLDDENDVKCDADVGKTQLQRVAGDAAPVTLETGVDNQLKQGQHSASDVEQDLRDAPAHGRLAVEVHDHLGDIFDKGADELHIAQSIQLRAW